MLLVKPDTILRWHREGFRLFWRWRSTPRSKPKQRIDAGVIEFIGRMARENAHDEQPSLIDLSTGGTTGWSLVVTPYLFSNDKNSFRRLLACKEAQRGIPKKIERALARHLAAADRYLTCASKKMHQAS